MSGVAQLARNAREFEVVGQLFRNAGYRRHLASVLARVVDVTPLQHFRASFIKWRYETLATVIEELLPYRAIAPM